MSSRLTIEVAPPFRLDLTVMLLQRLPSHPVEVWDGGRYLRAFATPRGPVTWVVRQDPTVARLLVDLHGPAGDPAPWRRRIARALGLDADVERFHARARRFPSVAAMARRVRGVRPPRFAALHESFASVLLFQQLSLASALATLRRMVVALTAPVTVDGVVLHPFPSAVDLAQSSEAALQRFGMSRAKARALRGVAEEIVAGRLREEELERLGSPPLLERLRELPGVGPWTASLLLLRGFGRIDQFPPGDVAAEKLLRRFGSAASGRELLEALGDARGMLYYVLFLERRLAARDAATAGDPGR